MKKIDDAIIEGDHQSGDGRECRTHPKGHRDHPVDIDPEQVCHLHVLLAGALRAAERGRRDEGREPGHQRQRHQHDEKLQIAEANGETAALEHREPP